jgi:hypothetical protein
MRPALAINATVARAASAWIVTTNTWLSVIPLVLLTFNNINIAMNAHCTPQPCIHCNDATLRSYVAATSWWHLALFDAPIGAVGQRNWQWQ